MLFKTWFATVAITVAAVMGFGTSIALGQAPAKYEDLKNAYDSAVGSLKAAQEAKNQLAQKNEELTKQVTELQKQLEAANKDRDELQRQANTYAERTFNLRSQYAAWQEFLKKYPALAARWKVFLDGELLRGGEQMPALMDPAWPFRIEG
jgi:peptidoglycan hydrolase CwlO-like protein